MADINSEQPLVTVGVCCYNRAAGLQNTLNCITGQTYKNLEIVISQDHNEQMDFTEMIDAYGDERITYYRQERKLSMYKNFLFLLNQAKGTYFMWAADDDWWDAGYILKIMAELLKGDNLAAGFCDFAEVDEDNRRIDSYPDHLPLLQQFNKTDTVTRAKNYINQFEGLGKANLFYAIFKTTELRTRQVEALLTAGDLPCDMLINLTVLLRGNIVIVPELLRTCTVGNVKHYEQLARDPRLLNLGFAVIDIGNYVHLYQKWSKFIYGHFKIIQASELSLAMKMRLTPTLIKKLLLFYYDLVCVNIRLRGFDVFSKIRRKYTLN